MMGHELLVETFLTENMAGHGSQRGKRSNSMDGSYGMEREEQTIL